MKTPWGGVFHIDENEGENGVCAFPDTITIYNPDTHETYSMSLEPYNCESFTNGQNLLPYNEIKTENANNTFVN